MRRPALRTSVAAAVAVLAMTGCSPAATSASPTPSRPGHTRATRSEIPGTSAHVATSATAVAASGISAHTRQQVQQARRLLAGLRVGGRSPRTGYDREGDFGYAWSDVDRNGCGTRDDVLARDLTGVAKRDRCVVIAGSLADPYTGRNLRFAKANAIAVQIDHVAPLSLAWQLGAQQWPAGKRVAFANDPENLLAVDGPTNEAKSDSGPDAWLPPAKSYRCTYVIRFTRVAASYGLRVTSSMRNAISRQLDSCHQVYGSPANLTSLPATSWTRAAGFIPAAPTQPTQPTGPTGPTGPAGGSVSPAGYDCPPAAPIKGNISSSGEKIYHEPSDPWYSRTKPEACFATPAAAVAAGFRAPRG